MPAEFQKAHKENNENHFRPFLLSIAFNVFGKPSVLIIMTDDQGYPEVSALKSGPRPRISTVFMGRAFVCPIIMWLPCALPLVVSFLPVWMQPEMERLM